MSETIEAKAAEPAPQVVSAHQQFADALEAYFRITAFGLCTANPQIPIPVMVEAIASAMGAVISGMTKGPIISDVVRSRDHLSMVMTNAVRMKYPALDMTPANANIIARPN